MRKINNAGASLRLLQRLDNQSASTTASITDTDTSNLAALLLQDADKGSQDTGTAGTEWVTECNCTSVNIDLLSRKVEEFHICESDDAERLVDLECVDGVLGDAGMLESLGDGECWGGCELAGCLGGVSPAENFGDGLEVEFLELGFGDEDDGCGSVVEGGGVRGGDGSGAGDECWLHGLELVGVELFKGDGKLVPRVPMFEGMEV